jgi:large-conductance mechanosensitive channel
MMACGARVIEILSGKVSNYFPVQKDNFLITVVGLAKTQEPTTVVRRLLFIDSTNFIYLINDIRARLHSMKLKAKVVFSSLNNNEMTSIISKPLNSRIKSFDVAITKSHELRKAYCVVQYSLLSPQDQSKISYAQFVADTLAHVSIGSSIRYTNINLVGNMDSPEEEEEEKEEKKEVEEEKNELEKIEFKNIDKETVYVLKPKKPSFGKGLESILKTMDIMHKLRIKISNAKMRHLGYGGTVMGKPEYIESRDGLNGKL